MSNKNLQEAIKHNNHGYYSCPASCGAVYHEVSFTHREFQCKDCNQEFLVPESIKIIKPKPFKRKSKQEVSNG